MRLEINYKKKICKEHKHVEAKQCATKQPMDHWRNQRGNQKILRDKRQGRANNPKPIENSKKVLRGEFIALNFISGNKKNFKQPSLTPKTSRGGRKGKAQN